MTEWKLEQLPKFVAKLRPSDEIAVEVTGNTRLLDDAVAAHAKPVVAINPNQFKVIAHSVKKTSPTQTHDAMVKLRTALKNKIDNIFSAQRTSMSKESLASENGLKAALETQFDVLVDLELKILA